MRAQRRVIAAARGNELRSLCVRAEFERVREDFFQALPTLRVEPRVRLGSCVTHLQIDNSLVKLARIVRVAARFWRPSIRV